MEYTSQYTDYSGELSKVIKFVEKHKDSPVVWWIYGEIKGKWTLTRALDDLEDLKAYVQLQESRNHKLLVYESNPKLKITKKIYQTGQKKRKIAVEKSDDDVIIIGD